MLEVVELAAGDEAGPVRAAGRERVVLHLGHWAKVADARRPARGRDICATVIGRRLLRENVRHRIDRKRYLAIGRRRGLERLSPPDSHRAMSASLYFLRDSGVPYLPSS